MRTTLASLFLLTLGCSCGAPQASHVGVSSPPPGPSASSADYEVHEWGLVRAAPGDVLRVGAVAPPVTYQALSVDKPVLYFHAAAPLTLASVTVQMPAGGLIREVWPLAQFGATARWENVLLDPTAVCTPSSLPTATDAPCSLLAPGDMCESATLETVRTADAACVTVGSATERFLFYRAESTRFTPPLTFQRTHRFEHVEVRNDGDQPIPGLLVRLWSDGRRTRALAVAPPAPHGSIVVTDDFDAAAADEDTGDVDHPVSVDDEAGAPSTVGPARRAIARTMHDLGLTQPETDAFLGAWSAVLFTEGGAAPLDVLAIDRRAADGDPAPRESFLYFLPQATTDGIATLAFDPPPRAVHRAIAVWSPLTNGASH